MNIELLLQNFHWLRPLWLVAIPLLIISWVLLSRSRAANPDPKGMIAPHISKILSIHAAKRRIATPLNSLLLLTLCGALAMAGPSWQRQASPLSEDEALLLIVLDVSRSMLQTDVQPSRIERSKQKINDLLSIRAGARSGLIAYSGSAHSVIPLTNDLDIVWHFLDAIDHEMMPRKGKAASTIKPLLDQVLRDSELIASGVPASVLLITDAIDSDSSENLVEYFKQKPHQLIVFGIGKNQALEPDDPAYSLDYTPIDEPSLRKLADSADGYYQSFSNDKRDISRINWQIKNHLLFVDDEQRPWVDAGYYLIFPMLLLSLLWFRRGWNVAHCTALVFTMGLMTTGSENAIAELSLDNAPQERNNIAQEFVDLWFTRDQQAHYFFKQGDYQRAAKLYSQPMLRGIALYLSEQFAEAAEVFASVNSDAGLFNQANALAHAQYYVGAVELYSELLNRTPQHEAAAKNRLIIQTLIDDINRMSESQQAEPGEAGRELGDAPQRADGAEQKTSEKQEIEQFSAEQILTDERIQQQWMQQVQQDPAQFLAVKFQMQLQAESAGTNDQR
ncbi:MAG: VWA domain-containing protein [Pseudomonadales bacterium]